MTPFLADAIFWVAVAACAVAQVGILRATFHRAGPATTTPTAVRRRATRAEELAWAVLPVLALTGVLLLTWRALHPAVPTSSSVSHATQAAT